MIASYSLEFLNCINQDSFPHYGPSRTFWVGSLWGEGPPFDPLQPGSFLSHLRYVLRPPLPPPAYLGPTAGLLGHSSFPDHPAPGGLLALRSSSVPFIMFCVR